MKCRTFSLSDPRNRPIVERMRFAEILCRQGGGRGYSDLKHPQWGVLVLDNYFHLRDGGPSEDLVLFSDLDRAEHEATCRSRNADVLRVEIVKIVK